MCERAEMPVEIWNLGSFLDGLSESQAKNLVLVSQELYDKGPNPSDLTLGSCHFMDREMRGAKTQMQLKFK
jgi:hypothetical protein